MTPKTLLSIEEFASLPDDGMKHELDEGELITHAAAQTTPRKLPGQTGCGAARIYNVAGRRRNIHGIRLSPHPAYRAWSGDFAGP